MNALKLILALYLVSVAGPSGIAAPAPSPAATPAPMASPSPTAPPVPTVPPAPLGLKMSGNSPDSITLEWYRSPNKDVTSYNVYASDIKEGPYMLIATGTERTATHRDLTADKKYFYKVSAVNALGEGAYSSIAGGFTFKPCPGAPFPVRIAKNMCVSLGATIVSNKAPSVGKLENLVDGLDSTSCGIGPCDVRIKLNTTPSIDDADYLMLNFRSDCSGKTLLWNTAWRALTHYTITESMDSTTGFDGTWNELVTGSNGLLDGVVVLPNHKPKWLGVKNSSGFQLCRLDVFRSAPAGFRNDYWIFMGDSLSGQDFAGGAAEPNFATLVQKQHPDRYPMVACSWNGGEMLKWTYGRASGVLPSLTPLNKKGVPTGTIICWESGGNDVGCHADLWIGPQIISLLSDAQQLCYRYDLVLVPVRIEYFKIHLNQETLEPANIKENVYFNSTAVNLAGVDRFCRDYAPYAFDPKTQLPYADYWNYTHNNQSALCGDGVHHTGPGSRGINELWAEVADKMVYSKQP